MLRLSHLFLLSTIPYFPKDCKFLGNYAEFSTYICRDRLRVVEVIYERRNLRDYYIFSPLGFRLYPLFNAWGWAKASTGRRIKVWVFSMVGCNDKWRLVRLTDSNSKEFYVIICCGS
ncbi:hypothetical protein [Vulcanisaeta sp.]|uniref:hypothetical protein n=1 Tax=Vulcanisaeta sp. TaxID=2020871 RepID=UPI003D0C6BA3